MKRNRNVPLYVIALVSSTTFVLLCVMVSCTGQSASEAQKFSLSKIAFESNRDGNPEIYLMNTDGTAVTRLSENTSYDGFAT